MWVDLNRRHELQCKQGPSPPIIMLHVSMETYNLDKENVGFGRDFKWIYKVAGSYKFGVFLMDIAFLRRESPLKELKVFITKEIPILIVLLQPGEELLDELQHPSAEGEIRILTDEELAEYGADEPNEVLDIRRAHGSLLVESLMHHLQHRDGSSVTRCSASVFVLENIQLFCEYENKFSDSSVMSEISSVVSPLIVQTMGNWMLNYIFLKEEVFVQQLASLELNVFLEMPQIAYMRKCLKRLGLSAVLDKCAYTLRNHPQYIQLMAIAEQEKSLGCQLQQLTENICDILGPTIAPLMLKVLQHPKDLSVEIIAKVQEYLEQNKEIYEIVQPIWLERINCQFTHSVAQQKLAFWKMFQEFISVVEGDEIFEQGAVDQKVVMATHDYNLELLICFDISPHSKARDLAKQVRNKFDSANFQSFNLHVNLATLEPELSDWDRGKSQNSVAVVIVVLEINREHGNIHPAVREMVSGLKTCSGINNCLAIFIDSPDYIASVINNDADVAELLGKNGIVLCGKDNWQMENKATETAILQVENAAVQSLLEGALQNVLSNKLELMAKLENTSSDLGQIPETIKQLQELFEGLAKPMVEALNLCTTRHFRLLNNMDAAEEAMVLFNSMKQFVNNTSASYIEDSFQSVQTSIAELIELLSRIADGKNGNNSSFDNALKRHEDSREICEYRKASLISLNTQLSSVLDMLNFIQNGH